MVTPEIPRLETLIRSVATSVIAESDHLDALDRAIGDGDHGANMRRGMEAVLVDVDATASAPVGTALQALGRQIVCSVGGASGPLFGTYFVALGKAWPAMGDAATLSDALMIALEAVMARGRSTVGQKTLLDVLAPATAAFQRGAEPIVIARLAVASAEATKAMKAERGRAAFLGDRSIGHMDPGARTVVVMIEALVTAMVERVEVHT